MDEVQPRPNVQSRPNVIQFDKLNYVKFTVPKEIIFINKIPETPNRKIDRNTLKKVVSTDSTR
jgi:acyl-coenzyme A synthetase/AMP-(fatty) acid ligase